MKLGSLAFAIALVTVSCDRDLPHEPEPLQPSALVVGQVLRMNGTAVPDASITLQLTGCADNVPAETAVSNREGAYRVWITAPSALSNCFVDWQVAPPAGSNLQNRFGTFAEITISKPVTDTITALTHLATAPYHSLGEFVPNGPNCSVWTNRPSTPTTVVDVFFQSNPTTESSRRSYVEARGGRVLGTFSVAGVRVELPVDSIPGYGKLLHPDTFTNAWTVPDSTKYDLALLVNYTRIVAYPDIVQLEGLGARVRTEVGGPQVLIEVADSVVPTIRTLSGVQTVSPITFGTCTDA